MKKFFYLTDGDTELRFFTAPVLELVRVLGELCQTLGVEPLNILTDKHRNSDDRRFTKLFKTHFVYVLINDCTLEIFLSTFIQVKILYFTANSFKYNYTFVLYNKINNDLAKGLQCIFATLTAVI